MEREVGTQIGSNVACQDRAAKTAVPVARAPLLADNGSSARPLDGCLSSSLLLRPLAVTH